MPLRPGNQHLGRLRFVPLALIPLAWVSLAVMIYGGSQHDHGWVLAGAAIFVVWAVPTTAVTLKLRKRIQAGQKPPGSN